MFEAELHILQQHMYQRGMQEAQWEEPVNLVPVGCVRLPSEELSFDPDEHVKRWSEPRLRSSTYGDWRPRKETENGRDLW